MGQNSVQADKAQDILGHLTSKRGKTHLQKQSRLIGFLESEVMWVCKIPNQKGLYVLLTQ